MVATVWLAVDETSQNQNPKGTEGGGGRFGGVGWGDTAETQNPTVLPGKPLW